MSGAKQAAKRGYYIVLGGPEHLEWFEHFDEDVLSDFFWTVPKQAKVDDIAFVYLTAPVSRIVGKLVVIGEPFYNVAMFDNPKTQHKWMAEIARVGYCESRTELTIRGLRSLFPDWAWTGYPRSAAKIPAEIIPPLLELTSGCR